MILFYQEPCTIIASNQYFIMQHDPFSWQIEKNHFIKKEELSNSSKYTSKLLNHWIQSLTKKEREEFINSLYKLLDKAGIVSLKVFSKEWYYKIPQLLQEMTNLSPETKEYLWEFIKLLAVFAIKKINPIKKEKEPGL